MKRFGELIYTPEVAQGEAISKAESHTPKIEAPDKVKAEEPFVVSIKVGPHPNKADHSIRRIEIYFHENGRPYNPVHIATIHLEPEYAEPEVKIALRLKGSGTLYAIGYCNLHGLWEARKEISVE